MLKIYKTKLNKLKDFGFIERKKGGYYHKDNGLSELTIDEYGIISLLGGDSWSALHIDDLHLETLYDLIKAGMVKKEIEE